MCRDFNPWICLDSFFPNYPRCHLQMALTGQGKCAINQVWVKQCAEPPGRGQILLRSCIFRPDLQLEPGHSAGHCSAHCLPQTLFDSGSGDFNIFPTSGSVCVSCYNQGRYQSLQTRQGQNLFFFFFYFKDVVFKGFYSVPKWHLQIKPRRVPTKSRVLIR